MLSGLVIRPAAPADAAALAKVHVTCWQQTYAGQLPQEFLDSLDVVKRTMQWQRSLAGELSNWGQTLLALLNAEAVGFASYGPGRDEKCRLCGEIYAINILDQAQGKGIGYSLFKEASANLLAAGLTDICLWVLSTNVSALNIYQRWGGIVDRNTVKHDNIGGQTVEEYLVRFPCASC